MTSAAAPRVTVLIPARDEERWIDDCLASVAAQDYPHDAIEVVVVIDAASSDGTDARAKWLLGASDFGCWDVLRSTGGGTPGNLNAGLAVATGDVLCRVDARSRIPSEYVRRCVEVLTERPEVVVVGGAQVAVPARNDAVGVGIARALNNRYAMGLARYRRGASSGPADTVYLGAFRTVQLRSAGGWSRDFPTNQDFELNRRLAATGLVWFDDEIPVEYVPRTSLRALYSQYVRFGRWKVRYWRRTGDRPRPRQLALLVGVPMTALGATAVLGASRRCRPLLLGALAVGAVVLEAGGTRGPSGGARARATSIAAMGAVAIGWLSGAWRELARPSRDG